MQKQSLPLIGINRNFKQLLDKLPVFSTSDATVLLTGETGTGKDLIARAIHYHSVRRGHPFVPVNCAALPDHLLENELFGHSRGAFTDAAVEQRGLLEEAEGGSLFLDEINSLSLTAQGKLLRFLQDHEYRPLGSSKNKTANVRVIAATNADLRQLVDAKIFRADLYHRLNILSLSVPSLRDRAEDIPLLVLHFLDLYGRQYGRGEIRCADSALQKLVAYRWPGNVRELQAVIQRAVILANSPILHADDILLPKADEDPTPQHRGFQAAKAKAIEEFERAYLTRLLAQHQGNISQAANSAQTERRTLQRLMKKYGLDRMQFTSAT